MSTKKSKQELTLMRQGIMKNAREAQASIKRKKKELQESMQVGECIDDNNDSDFDYKKKSNEDFEDEQSVDSSEIKKQKKKKEKQQSEPIEQYITKKEHEKSMRDFGEIMLEGFKKMQDEEKVKRKKKKQENGIGNKYKNEKSDCEITTIKNEPIKNQPKQSRLIC